MCMFCLNGLMGQLAFMNEYLKPLMKLLKQLAVSSVVLEHDFKIVIFVDDSVPGIADQVVGMMEADPAAPARSPHRQGYMPRIRCT